MKPWSHSYPGSAQPSALAPFIHLVRATRALLAFLLLALAAPLCWSETPAADTDNPYATAMAAATHGPATVTLLDQATLNLPADYVFIPALAATTLLEAMGNQPGNNLLGMVLSENPEASWMVVARFEEAGYVKDDDAKDWNADELLQSLREGTEAGNEERRQRGIPEFTVAGWVQPPTWEGSSHRLVWSAEIRDKAPAADEAPGINYNTYALGRDGYISLNLVTSLDNIGQHKPIAETLLSSLQYNEGKRYEDFNAETDHVAEYGLAALVGGLAAKKLGFFALIAAFVVKFAKVIAVAVIGFFAVVRKFFGGKASS